MHGRSKQTAKSVGGRILLLSWTIPPTPTGSATIVRNLISQFSADQMIVGGEAPAPGSMGKQSTQNKQPPVYHLTFQNHEARGQRFIRLAQLPLLIAKSIYLAKTRGCDRIVAVFPSQEFLWAGFVTAKLTGKKFYPYFHNTYAEQQRGWRHVVAERIQDVILAGSDHVFVMSQGMKDLFARLHPQIACSALVHSFDGPLPKPEMGREVHAPLRIGFCGNVNESCRDAISRFAEVVADSVNVALSVYSGTPMAQLAAVGVTDAAKSISCITNGTELMTALQRQDILFLPHGLSGTWSPTEYATIFPTKTIDYLFSGRPILAHVPPDAFITRFLRRYDCALIVDQPDQRLLASAIDRLRNDTALRDRLVRNACHAAQQFQASKVAAFFREKVGLDTQPTPSSSS